MNIQSSAVIEIAAQKSIFRDPSQNLQYKSRFILSILRQATAFILLLEIKLSDHLKREDLVHNIMKDTDGNNG
jgi:hypothetical protein